MRKGPTERRVHEFWKAAAEAQVELEREGLKVTKNSIWSRTRLEDDPTNIPQWAETALEGEEYRRLVELKKRLLVVPELKNISALKQLAGQGFETALLGMVSDLVERPDTVPTAVKLQVAKGLGELYAKMKDSESEEEKSLSSSSLGAISLQEERQMRDALELIPESYRAHFEQEWKVERKRTLEKQEFQVEQEMYEDDTSSRFASGDSIVEKITASKRARIR
jgi:hypothetical protein